MLEVFGKHLVIVRHVSRFCRREYGCINLRQEDVFFLPRVLTIKRHMLSRFAVNSMRQQNLQVTEFLRVEYQDILHTIFE